MRITRRHLQVSLGSLWLLDGALQCQPSMFGRAFASQILTPATVGQPAVLAQVLHVTGSVVSPHPAIANGVFALIQILLGGALLSRRFTRVALAGSVVWALSVWVVGEGLGGLATGATLLTGAPGAALLYAVIAVLSWPSRERGSDEPPSRWSLPAWSSLWIVGAGLQLLMGNNSSTSFTTTLRAAQTGAPGWIVGIDRHVGELRFPVWTAAAVTALYVLTGIWALIPGRTRQFSIALGVSISTVGWFFYQGLGDLTSGHATDPNAGPLIILLALAVVGAYSREVARQPVAVAPVKPLMMRAALVGRSH